MRGYLTLLLASVSLVCAQGIYPKTATVVDGGHRYDYQTDGKRSVMPVSDYADCVLWQAFSYSDNSDADFYDLSASGNDGAQTTAASQPTHSTADGGVYDFDGVDDYIDIDGTTGIANSATRSVSMWIKTDTAANCSMFGTTASSSANFRDQFLIVSGALRMVVDTDGATQVRRDGSTTLTNNVWMHLTYTWDGTLNNTGLKLFVNATEEGTGGTTGTGSIEAETSDNVLIASRILSGSATLFYEGLMGDVRVYDTVLTAAQVGAIYTNTAPTYGITP